MHHGAREEAKRARVWWGEGRDVGRFVCFSCRVRESFNASDHSTVDERLLGHPLRRSGGTVYK